MNGADGRHGYRIVTAVAMLLTMTLIVGVLSNAIEKIATRVVAVVNNEDNNQRMVVSTDFGEPNL